jgi:hypothetical protein
MTPPSASPCVFVTCLIKNLCLSVSAKYGLVRTLQPHRDDKHWLRAAEERPLELVMLPDRGDGIVDVQRLANLLDDTVLAVCVTHVSHLYGTVQPVGDIAALTRQAGAVSIVDGAAGCGPRTRGPTDAGQRRLHRCWTEGPAQSNRHRLPRRPR